MSGEHLKIAIEDLEDLLVKLNEVCGEYYNNTGFVAKNYVVLQACCQLVGFAINNIHGSTKISLEELSEESMAYIFRQVKKMKEYDEKNKGPEELLGK